MDECRIHSWTSQGELAWIPALDDPQQWVLDIHGAVHLLRFATSTALGMDSAKLPGPACLTSFNYTNVLPQVFFYNTLSTDVLCHEHNGVGWSARILQRRRHAARIEFTHARDAQGNLWEPVWLQASQLVIP